MHSSMKVNSLITVVATPLLDAGFECLLTLSDYEILKNSYENNKHTQREIESENEYDDMWDTSRNGKEGDCKSHNPVEHG